jgi:hypothetical protein
MEGASTAIVGLALYYFAVGSISSHCKSNNYSPERCFITGVSTGAFFVAIILGTSYVTNGQLMLINESLWLTLLAAIVLSVMAGIRCLDLME